MVTFAVPSAVKVPVLAVKFTDEPELTFTVAGTARAALSLLTFNVIPPAGTLLEKEAVQVLVEFEPKLDGLQASEERVTAG